MRTVASRLSLLVVALALVAGCSSDPSGSAATVDGVDIPRSELEQAVRELAGEELDQLEATERGQIVERLQMQVLTLLIQATVIEQTALDRGIELDPDDVRAEADEQIERMGGEEQLRQQLATSAMTVDLFRDRFVPAQLWIEGIQAQLLVDMDDVDLRTVRHILVDTEGEADDIVQELADGADFAVLAMDRSIDPGSGAAGGDLGPATRGSYVPGFEEAVWGATLHEVVGPVQSSFGFHVLEVTGESTSAVADLDPELQQQLVGPALNDLMETAIADATIDVAPGLGVWDSAQGRVVAS